MIRIQTGQLNENGYRVSGEEPGTLLDLAQDPVARSGGDIRYDLTIEPAGREWIVRGEVDAPVSLRCSRCAQFFSTTVRVSAFLHAYEREEHPDFLDVSDDVREDILLEIPGFPLCKEECKGLCPRCGRELNEGPCGCVPMDGMLSPWSMLDGLVTSSDSETPEKTAGSGGCKRE
ncbi:MAG: DUF177 domain-containing protein [Verrucomicrobiota bacterium]|nr:DUF177 domain-containing protein [Verrucomicrobiota bacterium]